MQVSYGTFDKFLAGVGIGVLVLFLELHEVGFTSIELIPVEVMDVTLGVTWSVPDFPRGMMAEETITLKDFDNGLFIAYNGTPLAPVEPSWTTKEIVQQLSVFRQNFINSKMKENGLRIAATL